jgi:hypothetical protein
MATLVTVACEGDGDVPIARRLLEHVGLAMGSSYPSAGKGNLDKSLKAYNNAATHRDHISQSDQPGSTPRRYASPTDPSGSTFSRPPCSG